MVADKLAGAGSLREMIVVMPNAFSLHKGSMYSSSVTSGDWETYVARDLVVYVDGHYRTIADRMGEGLGVAMEAASIISTNSSSDPVAVPAGR